MPARITTTFARRSRLRRTLVTGAVALTVGTTTAGWAPAAATPAAPSQVSAAVTEALVLAAGSTATADDSTGPDPCMGSAPEPLAYTTDRVVIRSSAPEADIRRAVRRALTDVGTPGPVGPIETILLPPLPGEITITPILSVTVRSAPGEPVPIVALARQLRDRFGLEASPDYFLSPSEGPVGMWPNGFPRPAPALTAPRAASTGSGITIAVYDTGLAKPQQSNHPANVSRLTPGDLETLDADVPPDGLVDLFFGGHEVAIAGTLQVMSPGAAVEAVKITEPNGVATDVSAARRMASTLRNAARTGQWPDIAVAAFGTQVCDVDPATPGVGMEPLGLQAVAEAIDRHDQSLLVASAGNRATSRPFYPAAFDSVLAVGALATNGDPDQNPWTSKSRTGPRADFSNFGPWVDAWAPGVELPTHHVVGLRFEDPEPVINGIAYVSGTSYSAPILTGMLAELMVTRGVDAEAAWVILAKTGPTCSVASGSGVALALVTLASPATVKGKIAPSPGDC